MRTKKWISRSLAKWTFVIGCATLGGLAMDSQSFAHSPFHHHHGGFGYRGGFGFHGGFGYHGWGSSYCGGYSSFYGLRSSYYYPSYSIGYAPKYYSVNYYTPTYFAPVYYAPTYYAPAYYPPIYYAPACNTWSNVNYNVGFPVASSSSPAFQVTSPLAMKSRAIQSKTPLPGIQVAKVNQPNGLEKETRVDEPGIQLVSHKPVLLQPYSPIWTKAAVGIVDDMIAAGELDNAHSSCKSMERIKQSKGAGVYLRQALLNYFSSDASSFQNPSTEEVLNQLELACEAGSQVQPSELNKKSLHDYFAACSVDVTGSMERLSKSVLESPNHSGRDLLLLSALLKLDRQEDMARLFAREVNELATKSGSFRWNRLLEVCLN